MMNMVQACGVVAQQRGDNSILVATMGAMFVFDRIEGGNGAASGVPLVGGTAGLVIGLGVAKLKTLLPGGSPPGGATGGSRISSVPLMGGAAGLGLGLALAQPQRRVVIVDGDASLLMELGSLVTVAQAAPRNLLHAVIRNGTQFTGLANLQSPAAGFSFAEAARNAGYRHAERIDDGAQWAERFPALLAMEGPVFVELGVDPLPQRAGEGFAQTEMPDEQFERMGREALAMQRRLLAAEAA
jgi:phosphonopyruvate decarboxylase